MTTVPSTVSALDAVMKEVYADGFEDVSLRKHTWLSMCPKADDFEGDVFVQPISYGNPQGRSASLTKAQSSVTASYEAKFNVTRVVDYVTVNISAELIHSTRSNKGAFVRGAKHQIDKGMKELGNSAGRAIYGDGTGIICGLTSQSSTTYTLDNASNVRRFQKGMTLTAVTTTAATTARANNPTVTAVSRSAGTITLSAGFTSAADTDYLAQYGDTPADNGGSTMRVRGLAAWLPLTAPTAGDSFWGVDRSVDVEGLSGHRIAANGLSIEENILTGAELIQEYGGDADVALVSHTNYSTIVKSLGSKVMYADDTDASYGLRGIKIHSSGGMTTIYADPDCPYNRAYVLTKSTWKLHHLEPFPHIAKEGTMGEGYVQISDADGVSMRARYWGNLVCEAPAHNCVIGLG